MTCPPHWWRIGPVQGPVAQGVCRDCGEVREFQSSFNEDFSPKSVKRRLNRSYEGKVVMPMPQPSVMT